ncbi:hypothetical protein FHX37_4481 [Haloactinospora alba]|uniref:Uncharacterized protein n=1 Tax=Haloactinospora alba TaxID=405555 RepID=A0A543N7E4_9ACTN|nr:hypothetical protein [Haloactinospora alba]TQN27752.1 hypothetical protein FHX37_4481 [Haloactinospora alba]
MAGERPSAALTSPGAAWWESWVAGRAVNTACSPSCAVASAVKVSPKPRRDRVNRTSPAQVNAVAAGKAAGCVGQPAHTA